MILVNLEKDDVVRDEENLERKVDVSRYEKKYSENALWAKIRDNVKSIGIGLIYNALQLYYVAMSDNCPKPIKAGIFAALGYFISPIDMISDFIPIAGYSDDALAIGAAIAMAQIYITEDIKNQAKSRIASIFGIDSIRELS